MYGRDDKVYGGLHAFFLLMDKPEVYGLPNASSNAFPRRNNAGGYLGAAFAAVVGVFAGIVALRAAEGAVMVEHFAAPPHWSWYIALYFFLAGLAGGSYMLATILRVWGSGLDAPIARIGYLIPLPLVIVCAAFLTIDLGRPMRFWHMLINTTPGNGGLNFKYWSPMSVGVWALSIFGFFALLSFFESIGNLRDCQIPSRSSDRSSHCTSRRIPASC